MGSRIVLFKTGNAEPFGIRVDSMDDVVTVPTAHLKERRQGNREPSEDSKKKDALSPASAYEDRRMAAVARGVCRLPEGLLVVLDPDAILSTCTETSTPSSHPNSHHTSADKAVA
jgi:chemotaxis signal transduction protein